MSTDIAKESDTRARLVERYAAWEAKLRENIDSLSRQRVTFYRIFFGFLIASTLGFLFGSWFGVGTLFTGIAFCGTGLYLTMMRGHEYDDELSRTCAELRRLRGAGDEVAAA
jgi:hypothetical protein